MDWLWKIFQPATDVAPNPFEDNLYKVVLSLEALKPKLKEHVITPARDLLHLEFHSDNEKIYISGGFLTREDDTLKSLGYDSINFLAEGLVQEVRGNDVVLNVEKLRLMNPSGTRLDLLRLASKMFPTIQRRIIQTITGRIPHILNYEEDYTRVIFHAEYFLAKVPAFTRRLGDIKMLRVKPAEHDRVVFYVHSNLIMMNLVQYFGPEYLSLEEIHVDTESQEVLFESFRGLQD